MKRSDFPDLTVHFKYPVQVAWRAYRPGDVPASGAEDLQEIAGAAPLRRADFLHGRAAAREALAANGCSGASVPRRESGAPAWPDGFVGSISHCEGLCVAVIAGVRDYASVGIDIERLDRVGPDLWPQFCTGAELARFGALSKQSARQNVAVTFSAKEAFFKLQWPLTETWLGFEDAEVEISEDDFILCLKRALPGLQATRFEGRYSLWNGHVIATVALQAPQRWAWAPYGR